MKVKLLNKEGKKSEKTVELDSLVWDVPLNRDLVAQVLAVYRENQRKRTAHTKTRGEVQGGGKKPWRQKGTGRARQGSIRSPIWVGGGVAFGPRSYKAPKKIPQKMVEGAMKSVLSERNREGKVLVLENYEGAADGKTRTVKTMLGTLGIPVHKVLVLVPEVTTRSVSFWRAARNIKGVTVKSAAQVNVYDVISSDRLVLDPVSVSVLQARLLHDMKGSEKK